MDSPLTPQAAANSGSSLSGTAAAADAAPTSSLPPPSSPKASLKRSTLLKFSHFATMECGEVLQAATEDLVRIFQLEVRVTCTSLVPQSVLNLYEAQPASTLYVDVQ